MPLYPRPLPGLRAARRRAGLSQQALATKAGLSISAIARLEQNVNEARAETTLRIANALGVPPEEITGGVAVPARPERAEPAQAAS